MTVMVGTAKTYLESTVYFTTTSLHFATATFRFFFLLVLKTSNHFVQKHLRPTTSYLHPEMKYC